MKPRKKKKKKRKKKKALHIHPCPLTRQGEQNESKVMLVHAEMPDHILDIITSPAARKLEIPIYRHRIAWIQGKEHVLAYAHIP